MKQSKSPTEISSSSQSLLQSCVSRFEQFVSEQRPNLAPAVLDVIAKEAESAGLGCKVEGGGKKKT